MTITLTREEAQQVLDAFAWELGGEPIGTEIQKSVDLLRARLAQPELEPELKLISTGVTHIYSTGAPVAQPEPEPVAWFTEDHREDKSATTYSKKMAGRWKEKGWPVTPLYTAPPQRKEWQGLTDEEIMDACSAVWASHPIEVANVVQDLLKEKNT